jgi:hypothetical protein
VRAIHYCRVICCTVFVCAAGVVSRAAECPDDLALAAGASAAVRAVVTAAGAGWSSGPRRKHRHVLYRLADCLTAGCPSDCMCESHDSVQYSTVLHCPIRCTEQHSAVQYRQNSATVHNTVQYRIGLAAISGLAVPPRSRSEISRLLASIMCCPPSRVASDRLFGKLSLLTSSQVGQPSGQYSSLPVYDYSS